MKIWLNFMDTNIKLEILKNIYVVEYYGAYYSIKYILLVQHI